MSSGLLRSIRRGRSLRDKIIGKKFRRNSSGVTKRRSLLVLDWTAVETFRLLHRATVDDFRVRRVALRSFVVEVTKLVILVAVVAGWFIRRISAFLKQDARDRIAQCALLCIAPKPEAGRLAFTF
jgi:hypothetical protein